MTKRKKKAPWKTLAPKAPKGRKSIEPHSIIALGGSVVAPDGIDTFFLKKLRRLIQTRIRHGQRFILVVGGGGLARTYQKASRAIDSKVPAAELDQIGIRATFVNAELVRIAFGEQAHPEIITTPQHLQRLRKPVAVAAGWRPGQSTDTVAVRIAEKLRAKNIIIAGRPAYVYEQDFVRFPNAQPFRHVTWGKYRSLISRRWDPGMAAPVDPVAARQAQRLGITAIVIRGSRLSNFGRLLSGKSFRGTVIE